ncbi:MAG: hypothetical protein AUH75_10330 [Gemmatimonadetes bacterium 13_1_40CM_4_65_7]|nr:MAG: hypothetical protein AUH75_10330 [Gemmatimonadetes bacterium 13_1_40CM_4_65_7]
MALFHGEQTAVSDRGTSRGLTQFLRQSVWRRPQIAEYKRHLETLGFEGAFWDNQNQTARNSLILKRRDVGVVDRARLESDFGEHHQAIPKQLLS